MAQTIEQQSMDTTYVAVDVWGHPFVVPAEDAEVLREAMAWTESDHDAGPDTLSAAQTFEETWSRFVYARSIGDDECSRVLGRVAITALIVAHAAYEHESGAVAYDTLTAHEAHEIIQKHFRPILRDARRLVRRRRPAAARRRNPGCTRPVGRRQRHVARSTSSADPGDDDPHPELSAAPRPAETPVFLCLAVVA